MSEEQKVQFTVTGTREPDGSYTYQLASSINCDRVFAHKSMVSIMQKYAHETIKRMDDTETAENIYMTLAMSACCIPPSIHKPLLSNFLKMEKKLSKKRR